MNWLKRLINRRHDVVTIDTTDSLPGIRSAVAVLIPTLQPSCAVDDERVIAAYASVFVRAVAMKSNMLSRPAYVTALLLAADCVAGKEDLEAAAATAQEVGFDFTPTVLTVDRNTNGY